MPAERVRDIGEFGLIDRIGRNPAVRGIGDDAAVLTPPPGHDLVVTADALIEGVHFRLDWTPWRDLGWKAMAVNVSDLAAMGARPAGLLVTLGLKPDACVEDIEAFYAGAAELVDAFGGFIAGGDIVAAPSATAISVTAFGWVETGRAVARSGMRPGDELWVTGTLGDSAGGLRALEGSLRGPDCGALVVRHNRPTPRVWEAEAAVGTGAVRAMIDLSDGLAGDLGHMCRASGCGAGLDAAAIPISGNLREAAAACEWDCLDLALRGGEDYELLMAVTPGEGDAVRAAVGMAAGTSLTRVGSVVSGTGITLTHSDGRAEPLAPQAFRHF